MSFDQRAPQEPVKFVCVNGDFNTYNIAVNVGRYVRGGFSRNTSSSTSLRAIITGKNVSSSLIEEDCGRDSGKNKNQKLLQFNLLSATIC